MDTSDPLSLNLYTYCVNNPVMYVDPSGHYIESGWDLVSLCISIGEVIATPTDFLAWVGAAGDLADLLIPCIGGIGEIVDVANASRKAAKVATEGVEAANTLGDTAKAVKGATEVGEAASEAASSKILRKNLTNNKKVAVPSYKNAAHHIVAGTSKYAKDSREILEKFDIGINDAVNGVFLPTVKGVSSATYHQTLHTKAYFKKVYDMLSTATTREEAIRILNDINSELSAGTFMK